MRIDSNSVANIPLETGGPDRVAGHAKPREASRSADSAHGDTVQISEASALQAMLLSASRDVGKAHAEKIKALRQFVSNSTYHVAPEKIAAAIYKEAALTTDFER